ncbi:unnamed protein product, partial [Mesorhabditis spiculigera]
MRLRGNKFNVAESANIAKTCGQRTGKLTKYAEKFSDAILTQNVTSFMNDLCLTHAHSQRIMEAMHGNTLLTRTERRMIGRSYNSQLAVKFTTARSGLSAMIMAWHSLIKAEDPKFLAACEGLDLDNIPRYQTYLAMKQKAYDGPPVDSSTYPRDLFLLCIDHKVKLAAASGLSATQQDAIKTAFYNLDTPETETLRFQGPTFYFGNASVMGV